MSFAQKTSLTVSFVALAFVAVLASGTVFDSSIAVIAQCSDPRCTGSHSGPTVTGNGATCQDARQDVVQQVAGTSSGCGVMGQCNETVVFNQSDCYGSFSIDGHLEWGCEICTKNKDASSLVTSSGF